MDLNKAIMEHAETKRYPDESGYQGISTHHVSALAEKFGNLPIEIELAALRSGVVPERYVRNMKLLTLEDQARLLESKVAVVGLGGLGGGVVEILARTGIGSLTLVDGDVFEDSNLNRQFLSLAQRLGMPKADAALERVRSVNPSIRAVSQLEFMDSENISRILQDCHLVVDCLDNIRTRMLLEKGAKASGIPMVSAAVAGLAGQITTIFPEDPGLKLIFGEEPAGSGKGAEATLGCLPQAVTLLSSLECAEVIKILLGKGTLLRNRLLVVDLMENTFEVLRLS